MELRPIIDYNDKDLWCYADRIGDFITIRGEGNKNTYSRKTDIGERITILNLVYGALLGMRWVDTENARAAILDAVEFQFNQFFTYAKGYETVYNPLDMLVVNNDDKLLINEHGFENYMKNKERSINESILNS